MSVAGVHSITMVDLDHIAIASARSGKDDRAGCGGRNCCAPWATKIQARMERDLVRERVDTGAKIARQPKARTMNRRCQRHLMQCGYEFAEFVLVRACAYI